MNQQDLPYLLTLLEDDSEVVRAEVGRALRAFGPKLETLLQPYASELKAPQLAALNDIKRQIRREVFETGWWSWLDMPDELYALEYALDMLAYLDHGMEEPSLAELLEDLVQEYYACSEDNTIPELMHFLFDYLHFSAPEDTYYAPENSNLVYVIQQRSGIPISICCIAILLGGRLGIPLHGWNLPGHFMMMSEHGHGIEIYDPFDQGKKLSAKAFTYLQRSLSAKKVRMRDLKARKEHIVMRVLNNLMHAYARRGEDQERAYYQAIQEGLIGKLKERGWRR